MNRTVRSMIVILSFGCFFQSAAGAETLRESFNKTYSVKSGSNLILSNVNGNVEVGVWNRPEVRVIAEKKIEGKPDYVRKAMSQVKIEVQQSGGSLQVKTRMPKDGDGVWSWLAGEHVSTNVNYRIQVPQNMNLTVATVNGRIAVLGVHGLIELETTNGAIQTSQTAGSLKAETTNGSINAELTSVSPGRSMTLETTNGGISVMVPGTMHADVEARTTNGRISSDLPITVQGKIMKNSLSGKLNGGGPELILRTTNGGIDIRKGK